MAGYAEPSLERATIPGQEMLWDSFAEQRDIAGLTGLQHLPAAGRPIKPGAAIAC